MRGALASSVVVSSLMRCPSMLLALKTFRRPMSASWYNEKKGRTDLTSFSSPTKILEKSL